MAGDLDLENLEEYIIDEDKIVSYKWLSKTLSLHVNQAKQQLEKFVKEWRKKPNSEAVFVSYVVYGTQETQNGHELTKVVVAGEDRLEDVKKQFKSVLSQHIYSVQKSQLKDSSVLFTTDFDVIKDNLSSCNRFSAITCKEAKPRSQDDLQRLKTQSQKSSSFQASAPARTTSSSQAALPKLTNGFEKSPVKKSQDAAKKRGLDAFTVKTKKDEDSTDKKAEKKGSETKLSQSFAKQKKGGLFAYTSKKPTAKPSTVEKEQTNRSDEASSVQKEKPENKEKKNREKEEEMRKEKLREKEKKQKEADLKKQREEEAKMESALKKKTDKKQGGDKRKARNINISDSDEEKEKPQKESKGKKRRRVIQEVSSSSESEEEEEQEEEDMDDSPIPPTPEPSKKVQSDKEEEESTPTTVKRKGRKTKKVLKKKTFVDDDGCMVTEKVWEYESTDVSEDEEAPPPKKPSPALAEEKKDSTVKKKKDPSPVSGRKQTALTSFFQKK